MPDQSLPSIWGSILGVLLVSQFPGTLPPQALFWVIWVTKPTFSTLLTHSLFAASGAGGATWEEIFGTWARAQSGALWA